MKSCGFLLLLAVQMDLTGEKGFSTVLPDLELSSLCGSLADFYGCDPVCIEAGEAFGVHKLISGTA